MSNLNRVATLPKNTELEISGIKMKNGFNVEIPYDLLHVHPGTKPEITLLPEIFIFWRKILRSLKEYWGSNAQEFYPERWFENESLSKAWFFQPFGGGPRNCVGLRLARMEIKLGILKIIQKFDPMWVPRAWQFLIEWRKREVFICQKL